MAISGHPLMFTDDSAAEYVESTALRRYSGAFVFNGEIRSVNFQARDRDEAVKIAQSWNVGVKSEILNSPEKASKGASVACEAYSLKEACHLLGGVSAVTVYRWVIQKKLSRVPGIRKVLITRQSILRCVGEKS